MDMVMLGKCVCAGFWTDRWFFAAPVVCRNQGGMSVHSMGGKHTHIHTLLLTHMARVVGIRIMTVRNTCSVLPFWQ